MDRELLRKLERAASNTSWDLYAYLHYVDDGNCAAEEAPPGKQHVHNKFVVKPELVEEDRKVPGDQKTADLVAQVANSTFLIDSSHYGLPLQTPKPMVRILDLQVGVVGGKLS